MDGEWTPTWMIQAGCMGRSIQATVGVRPKKGFQSECSTYLQDDLMCVEWDVQPDTLTHSLRMLEKVEACGCAHPNPLMSDCTDVQC